MAPFRGKWRVHHSPFPGKDFHVHVRLGARGTWTPSPTCTSTTATATVNCRRPAGDRGRRRPIGSFSALVHRDNPPARSSRASATPILSSACRRNVGDFASIVHAAIGYRKDVQLLNAVFPNCKSSGGSIVARPEEVRDVPGYYWADRPPMPNCDLEEIIARHNLPYVNVLKLDCEGSEWDIL